MSFFVGFFEKGKAVREVLGLRGPRCFAGGGLGVDGDCKGSDESERKEKGKDDASGATLTLASALCWDGTQPITIPISSWVSS